jgi:Spy/CpxP family protein refolding chaperone
MRSLSVLLTLFVAVVVCPKLGLAGEPDGEAGEHGRGRMAVTMADLHLTDEQETKIADIMKECRPKIKEASKDLAAIVKDEVEKVRGILTADQKGKLEGLKEERKLHRIEGLAERIAHLRDLDLTDVEITQIGEIREEYRPKIEKVMQELTGVLTDEQRRTREEGLKAGESRREVRESLNLTEDQKAKMEVIGKDLVAVVRDELEKIKSLLTAEQQQQLAALKEERQERVRDQWASRIANLAELNLTDEQKTKIAEVREEFRPKVHEAGNKLRGVVRDEVAEVLAVFKG